MGKNNNQSTGKLGEKVAAEYVRKLGYKILTINFRYGRFGEIDIVALDGEYICFIEVKTRSSLTFGTPSEAVGKRKQENIIKIAQVYLKKNNLLEHCARFDIIEVLVSKSGGQLEITGINLIKNAF